jgi:hypothetical protein
LGLGWVGLGLALLRLGEEATKRREVISYSFTTQNRVAVLHTGFTSLLLVPLPYFLLIRVASQGHPHCWNSVSLGRLIECPSGTGCEMGMEDERTKTPSLTASTYYTSGIQRV